MQNDKIELHTLGSLQHLGENMLAFLLKIAASSHLPKASAVVEENKGETAVIYFDILVYYNCRNFILFHALILDTPPFGFLRYIFFFVSFPRWFRILNL